MVILNFFLLLYGYVVIFGLIFIEKLDKQTLCKGDTIISGRWRLIFFVFNWMCYFFIDKIKEKRKIEFMERRILMYENMIKSWTFGGDILRPKENDEYLSMKRYLKITKIKKRI